MKLYIGHLTRFESCDIVLCSIVKKGLRRTSNDRDARTEMLVRSWNLSNDHSKLLVGAWLLCGRHASLHNRCTLRATQSDPCQWWHARLHAKWSLREGLGLPKLSLTRGMRRSDDA